MTLNIIDQEKDWNEFVLANGGHPLQLWGWGQLKAAHGWQVQRVLVENDGSIIGGAQILERKLPRPFNRLCYIPRGPILLNQTATGKVLDGLTQFASSRRAVTLKIEPDWPSTTPLPRGWRRSKNSILLAETLVLDLAQSEANLLNAMSPKNRQYIRKSAKAITVRRASSAKDIDTCLGIYRQTAKRAGFALHDTDYYHDLDRFLGGSSQIFIAEADQTAVAFLWLAASRQTAFELYGGVSDRGQALKANYILKWSAILHAKTTGVQTYDLNGLLEGGVRNFKLGFSSCQTQFIGTLDLPLSPTYPAFNHLLPTGKKIVRRLKRLVS